MVPGAILNVATFAEQRWAVNRLTVSEMNEESGCMEYAHWVILDSKAALLLVPSHIVCWFSQSLSYLNRLWQQILCEW